ncbi:hypothetical protein LOK49_LG15G01700 [Camellia lanceoleosa]|uniref:Uncharacterized protein n=1 Tax=Camellia lanceoleosa TaxID=1840588 RepID=A0ACC0F3C4_9ERIC|nr:hypothetical protein LOK49_LG15G01700 [Camellia lanceoleosa]
MKGSQPQFSVCKANDPELKLQGEKTGCKGHLSVATELKGKGELVAEGSWSNTSAVAKTIFCAGNSNDEGTCAVESSLPTVCLQQKQRCNQIAQKGDGNQLDIVVGPLQQSVECTSSSKGIIKGAKSRSPIEPIFSSSVSTGDILQEAHATLQVGERLGFDFKGQEAEVIKKLTHMEEQDKERLGRGNGMVE